MQKISSRARSTNSPDAHASVCKLQRMNDKEYHILHVDSMLPRKIYICKIRKVCNLRIDRAQLRISYQICPQFGPKSSVIELVKITQSGILISRFIYNLQVRKAYVKLIAAVVQSKLKRLVDLPHKWLYIMRLCVHLRLNAKLSIKNQESIRIELLNFYILNRQLEDHSYHSLRA